jgi:hypothetical protein
VESSAKDRQISQLSKSKEEVSAELGTLQQEMVTWGAEVASLEEAVGSQYDAGFNYALEQVKVLFPDIDLERLGEADALMRIVDGKLVPFAPLEG